MTTDNDALINAGAAAAAVPATEKATMDKIWGDDDDAHLQINGETPLVKPTVVPVEKPDKPAASAASDEDGDDDLKGAPRLAPDLRKPSVPAKKEADSKVPATPAGDEDEPIPEHIQKDPKQHEAWVKVKSEKKELKSKLTEMETELAQARQKLEEVSKRRDSDETLARIEQLETQLRETEERLGQHDIVQTKSFQDRYDNPFKAKVTRLTNLIGRTVKDEAELRTVVSALLNPEANRDEVLSQFSVSTQASAGTLLSELDEILEQRNAAIADWRETKAQLGESEIRTSLQDLNKSIIEDSSKAVESLRTEGNYLYMISQEDEEWNKGVRARVAALHGVLKNGTKEEMVKYVADGLTARVYREWYEKEHARAEKLAALLAKEDGMTPRLGGGAVASPISGGAKKPMGMKDRLDTIFGSDGDSSMMAGL